MNDKKPQANEMPAGAASALSKPSDRLAEDKGGTWK